jgi:hypothetical protein
LELSANVTPVLYYFFIVLEVVKQNGNFDKKVVWLFNVNCAYNLLENEAVIASI